MGELTIKPKKQSITSVKHQDLEKKKEKYWKKGIGVDILNKVSNPHPTDFNQAYKRLDPQPENILDIKSAKDCLKDFKDIRLAKWDVSRRDELPFSRKAYLFVAESKNKNVDELVIEIEKVEKKYKIIRDELKKKVSKPIAITKVISI